MTAHSLSFAEARNFDSGLDGGERMPRPQQVRCHLVCAGRQLRRLRFRRLPFHARGIFRALCSSL